MNFFDHQDAARKNTNRLVFLYVLSIISIILSVYSAVLITASLFGYKSNRLQTWEQSSAPANKAAFEREIDRLQPPSAQEHPKVQLVGFRGTSFRNFNSPNRYRFTPHINSHHYRSQSMGSRPLGLWEPELFFLSATGAILVIGAGSWHRFSSLRAGGAVIAEEMGGRLILPEIAETDAELQLLNVVEEMAIASGVPLPLVYILDGEPGMNAFAAGYTIDDAVIGVTRGSLDNLNRDEMQGVIGHEFSHILNGDMKLNLQLIAALHGIMMIYVTGRLLMPYGYERWRLDGTTIFGALLMGIGYLGYVWGRVIQSAVSRERAYLADASSAQFTRNPEGLASALGKISSQVGFSVMNSPRAVEMSHMLFASGSRLHWFNQQFATHPPVEMRLKRLGSHIDYSSSERRTAPATYSSSVSGIASNNRVQAAVSTPAWVSEIAPPLQMAVSQPSEAIPLAYGLLLAGGNSALQSQQIDIIRQIESESIAQRAIALAEEAVSLKANQRLPLLEAAMTSLEPVSAAEREKMLAGLQTLGELDPNDCVRQSIFYSLLEKRLQADDLQTEQYDTLGLIWQDCLVLFSLFAHLGQSNEDAMAYSFRCALDKLPGAREQEFPKVPPAYDFNSLTQALNRLSRASVKLKTAIADAAFYIVTADRQISDLEADLLRAIAIILDRPLPPLLQRHFKS